MLFCPAIEGRAVPLLASTEGGVLYESVFRLSGPTRNLFLQTATPSIAALRDATLWLHPIGRIRATGKMLAAHRRLGGWRQWAALGGSIGTMLTSLVTARPADAARHLQARYYHLLARLERERTGDLHERLRLRLYRLKGLPVAQLVDMEPGRNLKAEGVGSEVVWRSTGNDPGFVSPHFDRPLPAGWYRLRMRIRSHGGDIVSPCLYPDYGQGTGEATLIALGEPDREGHVDVLFVLMHPVRSLRLDPTMRKAEFIIDHLRLARLGRLAALTYMLFRINSLPRGGSAAARTRAFAEFVVGAISKGVSTATRELYNLYSGHNVRGPNSYSSWIERYDGASLLNERSLKERAEALTDGPLISILVPVYETPEIWLRKCLESVMAQVYERWELCVADDASPAPHVRTILDEYAAKDSRIKVVHREVNGHISLASNSALELATGAYIGLLDHDDELRPHALLEMAEAIVARPRLKLLYSDEDKIDERGRRFQPYFKPDWNPDLMCSQNYLCHFSVIEARLMREVGGFRQGYEGSQDHDLLLRCAERIHPDQIHHIPKVLYHWRAIEGSTALERGAKDYAAEAGLRAVADHLLRTGADAQAEALPNGHYRVRWMLGPEPPKVSLIIPTRDQVQLMKTCVESIIDVTDYPNYEIVIVDNQSTEVEALDYLSELQQSGAAKVLRYDAPFNYSAINNWAISQSDGEVIALLNNDLEVISAEWLTEMVSHAMRPDVGAVGSMLYYPDDTIQHAGVFLGIGGVASHAYIGLPRGYPGHGGRARVAQQVSAVTGACLVVRRNVYAQVDGLDEDLQVAFNDVDFCLRLREAGYRNIWTPFAELYHHESASRGADDTPEKSARFRKEVELMETRWADLLYRDPAYNPNLTLFDTDFGFAFPPRNV